MGETEFGRMTGHAAAPRRGTTAERRGELHAALVAATERIIAADGLDAVKARALAEQAGCSVGAIYNVVADLDALILDANARTLADIDAALRATAGKPPNDETGDDATAKDEAAGGRLARLGLAYLDFAAAHPRRWAALFEHRMSGGNPVPAWYRAQQAAMFTHVEAPLAALRPDLTAEERGLLARTLFSAVHGMVSLGLSGTLVSLPLEVQKAQLAAMVAAMARGLAA